MAGALILVEAHSRWDAVDLARRLAAHHTYLVQLSNRRWHVCVRSEGELEEELVSGVRAAAERWASERHLDSVLRVGDREYELPGAAG